MERRLAAIMAADMVGYSRLMEADEARTLSNLKALNKLIPDIAATSDHGHRAGGREPRNAALLETP